MYDQRGRTIVEIEQDTVSFLTLILPFYCHVTHKTECLIKLRAALAIESEEKIEKSRRSVSEKYVLRVISNCFVQRDGILRVGFP